MTRNSDVPSPTSETLAAHYGSGYEAEHTVEITKPFYMGVYHVTQDEYAKVMGKNPSWFSPNGSSRGKLRERATGSFPVDNVSWNDARQFCEKLTELV